MDTARQTIASALLGGLMLAAVGCGRDEAERPEADGGLPTVSVGGESAADVEIGPAADAVDQALRDIAVLRLQPTPDTDDLKEINALLRKRNRQIVELAKLAVARTHADPADSRRFQQAVHHLMEARLQLAIQTKDVPEPEHRAEVQLLYQDAEQLLRRGDESPAAAEAGRTLVQFAEIMARNGADEEPRWIEEYARQARLYAQSFAKHDAERAITQLDAAGWSCEAHGRTELAAACYRQLEEQFPRHPRTAHVAAALRRLTLEGQPLRLAGPAFGGGSYFDIEELRGQVVLVAFWAGQTHGVAEDVAQVKQLLKQHQPQGFNVVTVHLDIDEAAVSGFRHQHGLSCPAIYDTDPSRQSWDNPLVKYYGIRNIPTYWLVGRDGRVISTQADPEGLAKTLPALLVPNTTAGR
jgi:hypothetical protein